MTIMVPSIEKEKGQARDEDDHCLGGRWGRKWRERGEGGEGTARQRRNTSQVW